MSMDQEYNYYVGLGLTGTLNDMRAKYYATDGAGVVRGEVDPVTRGSDFLQNGKEAVLRAIAETDPAFPDDTIRITVSQNAIALPCVLKRIRCIAGAGVSLAVYDDVNQSTGYQFSNFPQTLSAGQEATIPDGGLVAMHGVYCKFTGAATFDITVGEQK